MRTQLRYCLSFKEDLCLRRRDSIPTNELYIAGWVNLYQKLEIEKIQIVVKSFYQKIVRNFFLHRWHADFHVFANICKLPVAHTFKVVQFKISLKVVLLRYFKFCLNAKSLKTVKFEKWWSFSDSPLSN